MIDNPAVHKNSIVELFFGETIKATVAKFGTIVVCDKALKKIVNMVTLPQGQVHIKAIVFKLGTHISPIGLSFVLEKF